MERYVFRKEFFGGALFDKVRKKYFFLADDLADVVGSCDQIMSSDHELTAFLLKEGVAVESGGQLVFNGKILDFSSDETMEFPTVPFRIHLAVTYSCQLSCLHCFLGKYLRPKIQEMSTDEVVSLFESFEQYGIYEVLVSGGEPLTRPDIFEILEHATGQGMSVKLFSNGIALNREKVSRLSRIPLTYLSVSLDGMDKQIYEQIRVRSNFDRVVDNLLYAKSNLPYPVAVQFTCTKLNTDDRTLEQLVKFTAENGLLLRVRPVNPQGNALQTQGMILEYQEYLAVLGKLHKLFLVYRPKDVDAKQGNLGFEFSKRSIKLDQTPLPYFGWGCPGGYVHAFIDPFGNMHPCGFLQGHLPEMVHNVVQHDLQSVWLNSPGFLAKRGIEGNQTCESCEFFVSCRGGCRVRALHKEKDINVPDPYCRMKCGGSTLESLPFVQEC